MTDTLDKKSAELRQYLDDATRAVKAERDAARADADRLAAALRDAVATIEVVDEMVPQPDVLDQCRAALARHEETSP